MADAIPAACAGQRSRVSSRKRKADAGPRRALRLTTLQRRGKNRTASRRRTLQIAQAFYGGHKMHHLPLDDSGPARGLHPTSETLTTSRRAQRTRPEGRGRLAAAEQEDLNNEQISDHLRSSRGARGQNLMDGSQGFDMIARRSSRVIIRRGVRCLTKRISTVRPARFQRRRANSSPRPAGARFTAKNTVDDDSADSKALLHLLKKWLTAKRRPSTQCCTPNDSTPPRYTEATLLSAMETAEVVDATRPAEAMKNAPRQPATARHEYDGLTEVYDSAGRTISTAIGTDRVGGWPGVRGRVPSSPRRARRRRQLPAVSIARGEGWLPCSVAASSRFGVQTGLTVSPWRVPSFYK